MSHKKLTPRKASGRMSLDEMNVLGGGSTTELVQLYGTLELAEERYRHLWDTGQLRTNPGTRPQAFWLFAGPAHLRTVEAWLEHEGRSMPSYHDDFIEHVATNSDFDDAREEYLKGLE